MNKYLEKILTMGKDMYFGFNVVLRRYVIHPKVRDFSLVWLFCQKLATEGWLHLFFNIELVIYEPNVVIFYINLMVLKDNVATSKVKGVDIVFDKVMLGEILNIPSVMLDEYV